MFVLALIAAWPAGSRAKLGLSSAGSDPSAQLALPSSRARSEFAAAIDGVDSAEASATRPEWLQEAARAIAALEYRPTAAESGHGFQAPNRAHDLRVHFEKTGLIVRDRVAEGSPELLRLRLDRISRGAESVRVAPGREIAIDANRVEIRRPGLVEWFENTEKGLEQGFSIADRMEFGARSEASGSSESFVLDLAVSGARAELQGESIGIQTKTGRRLRYASLVVVDANGAPLASHFEVPRPDTIRLVVDDQQATYPIVIDPLLTNAPDTRIEPDVPSFALGTRAASAGDVNGDGYADLIVAGDELSASSPVYIFHGGPTGIASGGPGGAATVLTNTQLIVLHSVASAGDVNGDGYGDVIIGAPRYDSGQGTFEGAAFVYMGSPTGVASGDENTAAARIESNQAGALLGISVATAGDVNGDAHADIVVGASSFSNGTTAEGAAFVFLGSAAGIQSGHPGTAHAILEGNQASSKFGIAVASAGDVDADGYADLLVGASQYDNGTTDEGAAFVFHGSPAGIASGSPATADTILESNQGDGGLAFTSAPDFGLALGSAGDTNGDGYADVIIGARFFDTPGPLGLADAGSAFVFRGSATGVADGNPATAFSTVRSTQGGSIFFTPLFGESVGGAGDVNGDGLSDIIVGAPSYDIPLVDTGAAFVFLGSSVGRITPETSAHRILDGGQAGAAMGTVVGAVGDLDGDGYDDVFSGSAGATAGQVGEGALLLYRGGTNGISDASETTAWARLESDQAGASLGLSVASAGDVNADGFGDLVVGAPFYDDGQLGEGAAFVFHGSPGAFRPIGNPSTAATILTSNHVGAFFGRRVASAGDVNGDGYGDVVVGAPSYDDGVVDQGAAFVFLGSATGVASGDLNAAHARFEGEQERAEFGVSVASAGDVDGDGYGDVLVGALRYDDGETDEGAAFLYRGSASGIASGGPATAATKLTSDQGASSGFSSPYFSASLGSAGDVNGDGFGDVVVGAPGYENGSQDEGATFVYLGSPTGIASGGPATAHARIEADAANAYLGMSVASAGDVDADGFSDLIVSGQRQISDSFRGEAYVFHGSPNGITATSRATARTTLELAMHLTPQATLSLSTVSSAGDVNADGYADVLFVEHLNASTPPLLGFAFVFLGSEVGVPSGTYASAFSGISGLPGEPGETFQNSGAGVGDLNGDGAADIALGGARWSSGQVNEGAVFVYLGNSAGLPDQVGRPLDLRQRRGDGSGISVEPKGSAHASDSFVVEARVYSPRGRERGKLEVETCPVGVAFGSPVCVHDVSPDWVDLGTNGLVFSETITGLSANTSYSWRVRALTLPFVAPQPGIAALTREGRWRRLGGRSDVGDIRTVPEPGLGSALAAGVLAIGVLRCRRGRGWAL